jgi:hypothetical protein
MKMEVTISREFFSLRKMGTICLTGSLFSLSFMSCGTSVPSSEFGSSGSTLTAAIPDGTYNLTSLSCNGTVETGATTQLVSSAGSLTETFSNGNGCSFSRVGTFEGATTDNSGNQNIGYSWQAPTGASSGCSSLGQWSTFDVTTGVTYVGTLSGATLTLQSTADPCFLYGTASASVSVFTQQ